MKKKIVFVASRVPWPPIGGDRLKNSELIKALGKDYEVHFAGLSDLPLDDGQKNFLEKHTATYKVFVKSKWSSLFKAALGFLKGWPLQIGYYFHSDLDRYIQKLEANAMICALVRTTHYSRNFKGLKLLDMADLISYHYKKASKNKFSGMWNLVYLLETSRLRKKEIQDAKSFHQTFLFNVDEVELLKSSLDSSEKQKISWIPHGVNNAVFDPPITLPLPTRNLCFVGKMDYKPNEEAAIWFISEVLPLLPKDFNLNIYGAYPTEKLKILCTDHPQIQIHGFVDDLYKAVQQNLALVAPMQSGGGIQNKVLEGLGLGCHVFCPQWIADSLPGIEKTNSLFICQTPQQYADQILKLAQYPSQYQDMKVRAREYMLKTFTWDANLAIWRRALEKI